MYVTLKLYFLRRSTPRQKESENTMEISITPPGAIGLAFVQGA